MKPLTAYIPTGLNEFQEEDQKKNKFSPSPFKNKQNQTKKNLQ